MRLALVCGLLAGCVGLEPPPTADCKERTAHWPDADGDGIGDPGDVYVGCSPPAGWVDVPPPTTTTTGTAPTTSTPTAGGTGTPPTSPTDRTTPLHTGDTGDTGDTTAPTTTDTPHTGDTATP